MGLGLEVGILADLRDNDQEGFQFYVGQFAAVSRALGASGLADHHEPLDLGGEDVVSFEMYGYSGLHFLRRIAAHVWDGRGLPPPGDDNASKDPTMEQYYASLDQPSPAKRVGLFRRAPKERPNFDHLMQHSDAEGFYLPLRFQNVVFPDPSLKVAGEMIGSAPVLMEECVRLAALIQLPLDLDPESDEVWDAPENQGQGAVPWKRYGVESFTCLRLYHACKASIRLGAAIAFV